MYVSVKFTFGFYSFWGCIGGGGFEGYSVFFEPKPNISSNLLFFGGSFWGFCGLGFTTGGFIYVLTGFGSTLAGIDSTLTGYCLGCSGFFPKNALKSD